MNTSRISFFTLAVLCAWAAGAREVPGLPKSGSGNTGGTAKAALCSPSTAKNELDLNNVRARIETGGNMWQNRDGSGGPAYEVPKTPDRSGANALFAGALWMGGYAPDGQLKLAAVRFRQEGNDFWPGPLTAYDTTSGTGTASIDGAVCTAYDKTWKTFRPDAEAQDGYYKCLIDPTCNEAEEYPAYVTPPYFYQWPAHGDVDLGQDYTLAPYVDFDGSGNYDPDQGDYPGYDLDAVVDCRAKRREDDVPLFGDQNIWWVFNDKGNTHSESGGQPIGMEVRAQAFAFAKNDEVNNMTFYNYVLINQGTQTLENTYFGQWVDMDLGCSNDDFVGCDVERGLGYGYNGNAVDNGCNGHPGYGGPAPPPPAIGVDFFEGPFQDYDTLDNPLTTNCTDAVDSSGITYKGIGIGYGDGFPDNERYGMRAFVYHNNDNTGQGDPEEAIQYYRYLQAFWRDNTPMTFGGSGYNPAGGGERSYYMFPGNSDPLGWGTSCTPRGDWSEQTAGNPPGDRRFIQSAGPFTLEPGAYNNVTVGVVYARATSGGPQASVELMRKADDKAQSLFDNCFRILNGPDAPNVTIQELDRELLLYLTNPLGSNNFNENYHETDPQIPETASDRQYHFQGYQIFQLADATVGPDELMNVTKARLVAQVDLQDSLKQLVNWIPDPDINLTVPVAQVNGGDTGIVHSFRIIEDKFASGDTRLKNFQSYYYMAIAYGYNNYEPFNPVLLTGQPYTYLAGRKMASGGSISVFTGIPHKPSVETNGTVLNSEYGDLFQITRWEGQGNGGLGLLIDQATEDAVLASPISRVDELRYRLNMGPVKIQVVDPLKVPNARFELWFRDTTALPNPNLFTSYNQMNDAYWMLIKLGENGAPNDTVLAERSIGVPSERLILQWGISVKVEQTFFTGELSRSSRGLGSGLEQDPANIWYRGIPDVDGEIPLNWIRSGTITDAPVYPDMGYQVGSGLVPWDPDQSYEKIAGGTWCPWMIAGDGAFQPSSTAVSGDIRLRMSLIPSCVVVFTADKSKWTRCVVVEEHDEPTQTTPANVKKLGMRPVPSVDKNGRHTGQEGYDAASGDLVSGTGMSWFPGYAIDMETGERLNMAFGENSFWGGDIGRDMVWNPSDQLLTSGGDPIFGGCHWIYVFMNNRRIWSYQSSSTTANYLPQNLMPQYDEGAFMNAKLAIGSATEISRVYQGCAWVGSGLTLPGRGLRSMQDGIIPGTVRVFMDVNKPYTTYVNPYPNANTPAVGTYEPSINPARNGGLPLYSFSTAGREVMTGVTSVAETELDLIGIVPNPYYAFSGYETSRLDNRVKFVNLPRSCTISIYNVSGTLVRKFRKDNELTYLDWDLKNNYNVPIAGGTYICHIDVPGVGERVIKWFGVLRPVDLQNF